MPEKLYTKTAAELSELLVSKKISSVELTENVFSRIKACEPLVGAYITYDEEAAMKKAVEIDEKRARGEDLSPLAGVPMSIKDNICVAGRKMTNASKMLENFVPHYSATVAELCDEAGLVLTGKVNLDEFAMGSTCDNSALQKTSNPHDLSHVAGGSSGGSAASVSAGEVPLSLGSDTGGSIRGPASYCGVVGLKPTYGAVSRYGVTAFGSSLDQVGPLARSVEDAALLLDVIAKKDLKDARSKAAPFGSVGGKLCDDVKKMKIGIPTEYFSAGIRDDVLEAISKSVDGLKAQGAEIVEISLPMIKYAIPIYYVISSAEASSNLAKFDGVRYGYRAKDVVDLLDLYTRSRSEAFGDEVKRRIMLGTFVLSSGFYDAYYNRAVKARAKLQKEFSDIFTRCDVILTPATPSTAIKSGSIIDPVEAYMADICTVSANIAGIPAIALPCGISNGLPVGVQLMGPHWSEHTLLNAALAIESQSGLKNLTASVKGVD